MRAPIFVLALCALLGGCFEVQVPAAADAAPQASAGAPAAPAARSSTPRRPTAPVSARSSDELDAGTPETPKSPPSKPASDLPAELAVACDEDDAGVCQPAVLDISSMCSTTCALMRDRTLRCWGRNFGRFDDHGDDSRAQLRVPTPMKGFRDVSEVSVGCAEACVLLGDGSVRCWGYDNLPDGTSPVTVKEISNAKHISSGDNHGCAIIRDGSLSCWGNNDSGQLGLGTVGSYGLPPTTVRDLSDVVRAVGGYGTHYAWRSDGTLYGWGGERPLLLGEATTHEYQSLPVQITALGEVAQLSPGYAHRCVVRADGSVRCWGSNSSGQLGTGTGSERSEPVSPDGLPRVTQLSSGFLHTCAVLADTTVRCWGENEFGQIGDGTQNDAATPTAVVGLRNVAKVASDMDHTCALLHDGAVYCWGRNHRGMVGSGDSAEIHLTPTRAWGLGSPQR